MEVWCQEAERRRNALEKLGNAMRWKNNAGEEHSEERSCRSVEMISDARRKKRQAKKSSAGVKDEKAD